MMSAMPCLPGSSVTIKCSVTKPGAYEIAHCRGGASCLKWQVSADENRLTAPREPAKVTRSHQSSPDTIERGPTAASCALDRSGSGTNHRSARKSGEITLPQE
uniref:Uncharacterized protein n=1 Tax=Anopheles merus TaxID=30066 RepID=A0A182UWL4_ANOME